MTHGEFEIKNQHIKLLGIQKPNNYNTTFDLLANTKCNLDLIQMWEEAFGNIFFTQLILQVHNAKS
jgi:hypothetical protein